MNAHHIFVVLSVAAILGGCDSAGRQVEKGQEVGQEVSSGGSGSGGTGSQPASPTPVDSSSPGTPGALPSDTDTLADPCADATGTGTYKGHTCEDSFTFITAEGLSCQEARRKCTAKAAANRETSFYCTWNNRVIYRQDVVAGACNPRVCELASGTGRYRGYICGSHNFIITDNIPCEYALENCALNAANNPTRSFFCTWNDIEVFRRELVPGICNGLP
ncbi:hypothetical protein F0U60_02700 [Archangium minus]|uniref:Lipoprotein n=1 Tax=Archangium minus TaxID=83450 RepID=A0ABY9WH48_9BACT|nr:hypothetical protein F0U60_02700 [Archangium minus]